jgi:hypothetical protein
MSRVTDGFLIALALAASSYAWPAEAQDKAAFAAAQSANAKLTREYTWTSRTELKLKGESKKVTLEQVRYDATGALQKTPLPGGTPAAKPAPPAPSGRRGGRLKAEIVENKKEEFAELMQNVVGLVKSYAHLPPEKLQAFMAGAKSQPGTGDLQGALHISGGNALQPGDSLAIWIDPGTMMLRRIEVRSAFEDKPVLLTAIYQSAANGPTHVGKVTLAYPDKQVEVTVDNYDYKRLAP